jgi:molybdopterin molybdotransferase
LTAGTRLGPAQLAVAAAVGATEVEVFENPKVAVLATGDELVPTNATPLGPQIRNSNTPMLLSLLRRLGCNVSDLGTAIDDPDTIRTALRRGLEFDALFVTGGMSMGQYDYVPKLLIELGVDLKVTKLRIKPGKPFVFGTYPGKRGPLDREIVDAQSPALPIPHSPRPPLAPSVVFGLPGNPVSAFVCTIRLASRLLTRMGGGAIEERWLTGKLDIGMPVNGPREFYQPAIRTVAPGRDSTHGEFASITPLKWTGSADLFTLARANVLLVRPENDPPLPKGTILRVLEI